MIGFIPRGTPSTNRFQECPEIHFPGESSVVLYEKGQHLTDQITEFQDGVPVADEKPAAKPPMDLIQVFIYVGGFHDIPATRNCEKTRRQIAFRDKTQLIPESHGVLE
jgi:hypothetical protein